MEQVMIYTDGACSGNPGPGGYGAILVYGAHEKELSGAQPSTTNNRMELMAVIVALEALRRPCSVVITSDSSYVVNAVTKGWLKNWESKGFMKTKTTPVPNAQLWKRLIAAMEPHEVRFEWVRGHNGHPYNERCDRLATTAAKQLCREETAQ